MLSVLESKRDNTLSNEIITIVLGFIILLILLWTPFIFVNIGLK
jgi:hypothetical protein